MSPAYPPLAERFWAKVDITPGCWEWKGRKNHDGYGELGRGSRAHRVSFELHSGTIGSGLCVCHRCDNPGCVNPDHLFLGSQQENIADMIAKGRLVVLEGEAHGRAKLTVKDVLSMRSARSERGVSYPALARMFGVSIGVAHRVCNRVSWRSVP